MSESLLPYLSNPERRPLREFAMSEKLIENGPPPWEIHVTTVRDSRYKLVYDSAQNRFEMYDLTSDTLEVDDVFSLQGHFRSAWQSELRTLAGNAPQLANMRMGFAPKGSSRVKSLGY